PNSTTAHLLDYHYCTVIENWCSCVDKICYYLITIGYLQVRSSCKEISERFFRLPKGSFHLWCYWTEGKPRPS
ncbi:MAG: hypothetical protein ACFFB3_20390, partial [Candidatus Hodarchaeota archaeon]